MSCSNHNFNDDLLAFLTESSTPFHAVKAMEVRLKAAGFNVLQESESWQLEEGQRYYVVRNGSSIVAFNYQGDLAATGWRMVGAHTDSPCLRVKPAPELLRHGYFQLGVEVYGGALLNPWFDRDLSLAGRVSYLNKQGEVVSSLIDFNTAIATIPSLAIHLDREANNSRSINPQKDIPPIIMQTSESTPDFKSLLAERLTETYPNCDLDKVLDYELSFYDTQPPAIIGLQQQFLASARLDNLLSCYVGLRALIDSPDHNSVLSCNDHEEVGSMSAAGAQGPMLQSILSRIEPNPEQLTQAIDRSLLVSADNAHGIHPNYADKHDANHGPLLNKGPVIKVNNNQRYASNSETTALFKYYCQQVNVEPQVFVVRSDMACGSTIGPITAGEIGVKTIDVGVPTFAMHSIRELAGVDDAHALYHVLECFLGQQNIQVLSH